MTPDKIIIHHSATNDNETVSWGAIRRYHTETMGWQDIGYHAGVELLRDDYEILMGREWNRNGAHCSQESMNFRSLGLCLVGDFDRSEPPAGQIEAAQKICRYWCKLFNIPKDEIYPHSHFAIYKSCPGKLFPWIYFINGI